MGFLSLSLSLSLSFSSLCPIHPLLCLPLSLRLFLPSSLMQQYLMIANLDFGDIWLILALSGVEALLLDRCMRRAPE